MAGLQSDWKSVKTRLPTWPAGAGAAEWGADVLPSAACGAEAARRALVSPEAASAAGPVESFFDRKAALTAALVRFAGEGPVCATLRSQYEIL